MCDGVAPFVSSSAIRSTSSSSDPPTSPPATMPGVLRTPATGATAGSVGAACATNARFAFLVMDRLNDWTTCSLVPPWNHCSRENVASSVILRVWATASDIGRSASGISTPSSVNCASSSVMYGTRTATASPSTVAPLFDARMYSASGMTSVGGRAVTSGCQACALVFVV